MNIVLLGATDTTFVCAEVLRKIGHTPKVIVSLEESFQISYSQNGKVKNYRHENFENYCRENNIILEYFSSNVALRNFLLDRGPEFDLDLGLVAGWYHMVPRSIRELFVKGCIGIHASKLPEFRGGAPLNWAILSGCKETGVSLFELTDNVDDGPIWDQEVFAIENRDTIADLLNKANFSIETILSRTVPLIAANQVEKKEQKGLPSYSLQRKPEDGLINWQENAEKIDRIVRAVTAPYPGAYSYLDSKKLLIWKSRLGPKNMMIHGAHGQLFVTPEKDVMVVTGHGTIMIETATFENGDCAISMLVRSGHKRFIESAPANCLPNNTK